MKRWNLFALLTFVAQDLPTNSLVEDDATSEPSIADVSRFIPRMTSSSSGSHIISIGQLLESVITPFSFYLLLLSCNIEIVPSCLYTEEVQF